MKSDDLENELLKNIELNVAKIRYMVIREFKDELQNSKLLLYKIEKLRWLDNLKWTKHMKYQKKWKN